MNSYSLLKNNALTMMKIKLWKQFKVKVLFKMM